MRIWPRRKGISEQWLVEAAEIVARALHLSEAQSVAALMESGFDEGEAHRLVALLPLAFSRPVLEDLGVTTFVREVTATDEDGTEVKADLMQQPEYVGGLRLARKHRRLGAMLHETYERVTNSSADIDAASNALKAGRQLRGATVATSLISKGIARHLVR